MRNTRQREKWPLFLFLFISGCGLIETENKQGSINVLLVIEKNEEVPVPALDSLSSLRCIVKEGASLIHDEEHTKSGGSFKIEINNLEPASDYSVLLYGKNASGEFVGRGYQDNITVTEGKQTDVSISWSRFNPTPVSPSNGSTTSDNTPTFDWTSVTDAIQYELQVDNSGAFTDPEIGQFNLTSSDYTPSASLQDGIYYWRVKSKDSQDNWSGWSSTWSLMVETVVAGTVTDVDGNVYPTIKIGNQWWMAENLKVTRYRNGDEIPNVNGPMDWSNSTAGSRCSYDTDENNVPSYGFLYNWYAVNDSRKLAPEGWHVPTDEEWKTLEISLGMSHSEADAEGWRGTDESGKLKEAGNTHWQSPNAGATNLSGFTALPGGYRAHDGVFYGHGFAAHFWSSTEHQINNAWPRILSYSRLDVYRYVFSKQSGFSIRCVRNY